MNLQQTAPQLCVIFVILLTAGLVAGWLVVALNLPTRPNHAEAQCAAGLYRGSIEGAAYKVRLPEPEQWNGVLIIYAHGYSNQIITDPAVRGLSSAMLRILPCCCNIL